MARPTRILIIGGGYVGLYAAKTLQAYRRKPALEITLVEPTGSMTYQPLLPEVAGGHVDPRNVVVPLQQALPRVDVVTGQVTDLDVNAKTATIERADGSTDDVSFDEVIVGVGAVTRTFPTPGLRDVGIGFKTVEEAVWTRNHLLATIARAAELNDSAERQKALTFLFIGGGYTGVEALAELSDLSKKAVEGYPSLSRRDLRWILVEALDRVAPEVGEELSKWTLNELRSRNIDVRLGTTMKSCVDGNVELSDGSTFGAGTIVWTAGVKPSPMLDTTNLPRGPKGHVIVNGALQVTTEDGKIVDGAWSAGDCAQVPNQNSDSQPAYYPPNAQHALRQTELLARNLLASLDGRALEDYRYSQIGTVASYGIGRGAANVMGFKLRGLPAWLMHRGYHGLIVPTMVRKWLVFSGWVAGAATGPLLSDLSRNEEGRKPFVDATGE